MSSSGGSRAPSSTVLPPGWTDDNDELQVARFPSMEYGLEPGKMILYNNALSTYLVECDGKYFLWNEVSDGIDQIKEPTELEEILRVLPDASDYKVPGYSKMKLADMEVGQQSK